MYGLEFRIQGLGCASEAYTSKRNGKSKEKEHGQCAEISAHLGFYRGKGLIYELFNGIMYCRGLNNHQYQVQFYLRYLIPYGLQGRAPSCA